MRVLFLSPSNRLLGARQSLVDLATHLPHGVEGLVVCPGTGELYDLLRDRGVAAEAVRHHPWRKALGHVRARLEQVPALRRIVARFRPTVIHANEYHAVPQALEAAEGRVPVVAHLRNEIDPAQAAKYRLGECARVVCISRALAARFDGTPLGARCVLVHNGIDVSRFQRPLGEARVPLAEMADWPAGDLVVGLLGLVSPRKAQLLAAEAVAMAATSGSGVRLLLAGDPFKSSLAYGEELRRRIAAPDLAGRVLWLPFQSDVQRLYRACDANLLVSGEEGFGRTIIEAGALGLPSIGADAGGIPEVIAAGETGWIVPSGDAPALARALAEAASNRAMVAARGEAARHRVANLFTLEATMQRLGDAWAKSAEEHGFGRH